MKKATAKDFPGLPRAHARAAARAANTILEALRGLTCCQIGRVLAWASARVADPCSGAGQVGNCYLERE